MKTVIVTGIAGISFTVQTQAVCAQIPATEARAAALGEAVVAVDALVGQRSNPASLGGFGRLVLVAGHGRPFGMGELATNSVAVAAPIGGLTGGFELAGYGIDGFGIGFGNLGLAKRVRQQSVGFRVGLRRTAAGIYGSRVTVVGKAGWLTTPHRNVTIGAVLGTIGDGTTLETGISVRPRSGSLMSASIALTKSLNPDVRLGAEAEVVSEFIMRLGVRTDPAQMSVGAGVAVARVAVDVAVVFHARLGMSTIVTVGLRR